MNLKHLTLHFSPRMRLQNEPSIHPETYFKRFLTSERKLSVVSIALYNLFAKKPENVEDIFEFHSLESMTDIREINDEEDKSSLFFDDSWKRPTDVVLNLKMMRTDFFNFDMAQILGEITGLEYVYFVNRHPSGLTTPPNTSFTGPSSNESSVSIDHESSSSRHFVRNRKDLNTTLRDAYLNALVTKHGPTLVHLALPTRWPLSLSQFARLVRAAPNLTQLSLAVDTGSLQSLRLLFPFLQQLRVLRLLVPTERDIHIYSCNGEGMTLRSMFEQDDSIHIRVLGREMIGEEGRNDSFPQMKYVILGWKAFELGGVHEVEEQVTLDEKTCAEDSPVGQEVSDGVRSHDSEPEQTNNDGDDSNCQVQLTKVVKVKRREVKRVPWEVVSDIEILRMDSREVIAD